MTFIVFLDARYAKCLHRPIVIINQQYTKGEIHFINNKNLEWIFMIYEHLDIKNTTCFINTDRFYFDRNIYIQDFDMYLI